MKHETLIGILEKIVLDADIIKIIETSKDVMAAMLKETGIEKVDELIDNIKEIMEDPSLILSALAQPFDTFATD